MTGIVGYDIQYSYDFVVFLLCGAVGVAKKGENRSLALGHAWYRVRSP